MIGTPLSSTGGVQVNLMHVLVALSTVGVPGGPDSTEESSENQGQLIVNTSEVVKDVEYLQSIYILLLQDIPKCPHQDTRTITGMLTITKATPEAFSFIKKPEGN